MKFIEGLWFVKTCILHPSTIINDHRNRKEYYGTMADYARIVYWLNEALKVPGGILEIGVWTGKGTKIIGQYLKNRGEKRERIVIDPMVYEQPPRKVNFQALLYRWNTKFIKVNTMKEDSAKVFYLPVDLCFSFIDGCHEGIYPRHDMLLAWKHTVPGGLMVVDDLNDSYPAVVDAVSFFRDKHLGVDAEELNDPTGKVAIFRKTEGEA